MKVPQKLAIVVFAFAMLPLSGCLFKKKTAPAPPPQAQAPTITVPLKPEPLPTETTAPPTPQPSTTTQTKPAATKPKPKHRAPKKTATNTPPPLPTTPVPAPSAPKNTTKTVAEGGTNDSSTTISAEVPRDAAAQQRQETMQLLESTEANLRKVGNRSLNDADQATMRQIRNYITQSRLAMQDGDLERAYNLATKANLLCNEFVKRL